MKEPSVSPDELVPGSLHDASEAVIFKICVMVPNGFLDSVKDAMFTAGAGRYGAYDCCCWQTLGTGQFRPLQGSQPYSGELNNLYTEQTWKVEMICQSQYLLPAIQALRQAHPYEMPAFDYYPITIADPRG